MVTQNSTNNYSVASFIVGGNYSTIAAALTAASSGDTIFIKPGTYTENLTLKAGVNLTAFGSDSAAWSSLNSANVTIVGTVSASYNGRCNISGIAFQTNSAALLSVTGSNSSILQFNDCSFYASNHNGMAINSGNFVVNCITCSFFASSSYSAFAITSGYLVCYSCSISVSDNTANTVAGTFSMYGGSLNIACSTSSTGFVNIYEANWSGNNFTILTLAGTGAALITNSSLSSGSASTVSIGSGTSAAITNTTITSSNTDVLTGSGTLSYGGLVLNGTSSGINVTTQNPIAYSVPQGGTGNTSIAAYALVAGGTTSGGPLQVVSGLGTAGQVLTSNGANALPGWGSGSDFTYAYTNVNSSPYTVLTTDEYISVDCSGGAITLNFPNAPAANRTWIVKDRTGSAATHNITITTPGGAVTFDGATTYVMKTNYQAVNLLANATPTYEIY